MTMPVTYTLSWRDPNEHLFDVSVRFVAPEDDPLVWLPAWRPGRYLIQNYAADVREWSGNARKVGKSEWRIDATRGQAVTLTYRFYAAVLDAGSSFLDEEEAYVNPSNLLMCVDALRREAATLTIAVPEWWRIETQLPRDEAGMLHARDYDHLIDSPLIASGKLTRHTFTERDARIHLVFRGDEGIDTGQFVEPVRAVVRAQAAMFGGLPFRDYRFLIHVRDRWHGVEHEESTSIVVKRAALLGATGGDEGFDDVLSICSHELFHAWNVKRIVPAAFLPYDYLRETPTRLLWAMEGITSYYGELMLVRAGLWTAERYLEHLQKEIETLENAAGRAHLSLAQASWDGWLQEANHDRTNAAVSFYNKGEIVAALLDLTIRARTEFSLDDVMRSLWREYGETGRGLEEDAIERAVAAVTGSDFRDFFARYVDGTEPLPYAEVFGAAGVTVTIEPSTGLALGAKLDRGVVSGIVRGGAAMEAGLLDGDELLAIDDTRIASANDLARVMASLREGEAVELIAARAGVIMRRTLIARRDPRVTIVVAAEGDNLLRARWLRKDDE